jgi:hypothetical protein
MPENLHPPLPSTPNVSKNLPGQPNIVTEDLAPVTSTLSWRHTLCDLQNIALGGITNVSEDQIEPLTPNVSNCPLVDLDSIVPGGTPLATNQRTYRNLDVPQFLSSTFSDPLLYPSSNNPAPFTQDGSDPRIDEIITNQKIIMSSLNSLTGLVKQLIQQQHTSIPLCSDKVVGDSVQVVSNVGTSCSVSGDDCNILPSTDREIFATDEPVSQPSLSSDLVDKDELAAIKLKSSGPTAFAGALFRMLFTFDEMKGRNCRGLAKKGKLDEGKLNKIQEYVYKYYPETPEQLCRTWARCTQTIDSYIRNRQHKAKNI